MVAVLKLTVDKVEPLLRGQEHFWKVARTLGDGGRAFTGPQIASLSEEPHISTVTTFLRRLESAGFVEKAGADKRPGAKRATLWRLLRSPEKLPPMDRDGNVRRPRSVRQQIWNVIRGPAGKQGFTVHDLVAWGSTDDLPIKLWTAKSYVQDLRRGGYLIQLDPGGPQRPAVWRLKPSMNSGPLPPLVLQAKLVFDQNRSRLTGDVLAEEVQP